MDPSLQTLERLRRCSGRTLELSCASCGAGAPPLLVDVPELSRSAIGVMQWNGEWRIRGADGLIDGPSRTRGEALLLLLLLGSAERVETGPGDSRPPVPVTHLLRSESLTRVLTPRPTKVASSLTRWLASVLPCAGRVVNSTGNRHGTFRLERPFGSTCRLRLEARSSEAWPELRPLPVSVEMPSGGIRLRYIPGGAFWMGSERIQGRADERPIHLVRLSPFLIAERPLLKRDYRRFLDELEATLDRPDPRWADLMRALRAANELVERHGGSSTLALPHRGYRRRQGSARFAAPIDWALDGSTASRRRAFEWLCAVERPSEQLEFQARDPDVQHWVDWRHIQGWLAWRGLDLPCEAWFEYVCRGPGDRFRELQDETRALLGRRAVVPSVPGAWCGLDDGQLVGTVWQWMRDWWAPYWAHAEWDPEVSEPLGVSAGRGQPAGGSPYKVMRGGLPGGRATHRGGNVLVWRNAIDGARPAVALGWTFLAGFFQLPADLPDRASELLAKAVEAVDDAREAVFGDGINGPNQLADRLERFATGATSRLDAVEGREREREARARLPGDAAERDVQLTVFDDFGFVRRHFLGSRRQSVHATDERFVAGIDFYSSALAVLQNQRVGTVRWLDRLSTTGELLTGHRVRVNVAQVTRVPDLGWILVAEAHAVIDRLDWPLVMWFSRAGWAVSPSLRRAVPPPEH